MRKLINKYWKRYSCEIRMLYRKNKQLVQSPKVIYAPKKWILTILLNRYITLDSDEHISAMLSEDVYYRISIRKIKKNNE